MPGKTKKSISKRFRITKNKKLMRRPQHQDHLNAGDSGSERRKKKGWKQTNAGIAKKLMNIQC
jgi:ribosomal protein L35